MPNILWFNEVGKKDISLVGGKGANLGEMTRAGFPVPPGFAVTAQAYFSFIKETGLKEKIVETIDSINVENTKELREKTEYVRKLVKQTPMSKELENEIIKAYLKLGEKKLAWLSSSKQEYVAVRSSATAEDLPEASFAGQQETYLNVHGNQELLNAVKNCWASLFTARATYYRKKQGFKTEKVGISVIIQKMVNSEVSGIMFTADPTGDKSKIIIEAGFGLGEAIVSGSVTPDSYVVDKATLEIIEKKINRQEFKIIRKGKKNFKLDLSEEEGREQKLTNKVIIDIARIGKKIEEHYSLPQDIEWAVEKDRVFIVQSRAITTLKLQKKVELDKKRRKKIEEVKARVLLKGLPASPGIVPGKIKVVPSSEDIEKIVKGDILVTKMTNPDWVPVMKKSTAIITDEGGITCHAAIVSRELGIPCVVGTMNATTLLKDGQKVTVNGYTGEVYEGEIRIELPKKDKEKIILMQDIDKLENILKKGLNEKERIILKSKPVVKKDEHTEIIKRDIEEVKKFVELKQKKELLKEFGDKKTSELSEQEIEKETRELIEMLKEISAKVKVNVALPDAAERAAQTNADGVGLLRAEHMATSAGVHPAEYVRQGKTQELVRMVKNGIRIVAKKFKGKPVWYRTFDARTDEFRQLKGGEHEPREENPMLGWHGIRRDLDKPEMLKAQFTAIKQLREEGFTNVGVMLPFVINVEEVRKAKKIAEQVGLNPDNKEPEFGVMIETPASVWLIEELIKEKIAFISFGTNDLTQLTLGIDRNNEKIQKHFNELHPAVLGQIKKVVSACKNKGVQTSICGQAASNPEMVRKLVRMGITSVSANIDAVQKIRRVIIEEEKKMILETLQK